MQMPASHVVTRMKHKTLAAALAAFISPHRISYILGRSQLAWLHIKVNGGSY